jgi:uroporphyrinogen-III synthase
VDLLRRALKDRPGLRRQIFGGQVLAVGPRTRLALQRQGVRNVVTPATYTSDGIVDHLSKSSLRGRRILLTRATQGSETLRKGLRSLGALVTTIRLYDSLIPDDEEPVSTFLSKARSGKVNAMLFTSSLSATNLFKMTRTECSPRELRKLLGRCLVAALGPVTAGRLRRLGVRVDLVPKEYLIEKAIASLVDAGREKA